MSPASRSSGNNNKHSSSADNKHQPDRAAREAQPSVVGQQQPADSQSAEQSAGPTQPLASKQHPPQHHQQEEHQREEDNKRAEEEQNLVHLRQLLEQREREIHLLKSQLDKYKLALQQSHTDHQYIHHQRRLSHQDHSKAKRDHHQPVSQLPLQLHLQPSRPVGDGIISSPLERGSESPLSATAAALQALQAGSTSTSNALDKSPVLFRAGDDDSENEEDNNGEKMPTDVRGQVINDHELDEHVDLSDIIQDVGEIDLDLELDPMQSARLQQPIRPKSAGHPAGEQRNEQQDDGQQLLLARVRRTAKRQDVDASRVGAIHRQEDDSQREDEDIISDGLLTSLTDAAISNLSQLAALQERCESQQQQHSHTYQHHQQQQQQQQQHHQQHQHHQQQHHQQHPHQPLLGASAHTGALDFGSRDPFSASTIASQAAIAINAAAVASLQHHHHQHQQVASSSSMSPLQVELGPASRSLASVVAAAAAAAAAANDQHQHQHQHLGGTQMGNSGGRLMSADFYHSLQQQHPHAQAIQQPHLHQQGSPVTSLHFSPSTSITPSPSSLMSSSAQSSRRSASQATSSSLMSPISSPNYMRRQFLPDRLPLMSPSPTSGISSGQSSSMAHILHQQRSASALAGATLCPSGGSQSASTTPISGTGSAAVSPLMMNNKNSSQSRLNNMQIRHKFGYLGSGRAQFNSPHGFCLGLNQEIVVADTNNHRVCIFDKSGTYITQFGTPGKEEGQLWNPRKVAILHRPVTASSGAQSHRYSQSRACNPHVVGDHQTASNSPGSPLATSSGSNSLDSTPISTLASALAPTTSTPTATTTTSSSSSTTTATTTATATPLTITTTEPLYVVCDRGAERSRMQLFTRDGAFIKKIGIHYIDIVAGLAITQNGLIIVVDSVSPTVYIINGETGVLNGWFDCSGHMKEPSDIAVKSDVPCNEYFICDFKGHCVVVFNEQGDYLRKIGHDGLTSYPNGIDISDDGDILVGDSHGNRFHVVVFDRNGNFVSQFECPHVKVSRCCGLKITREGYIVTLAKNNHHVLVLDTIHI